MTLSERAPFVRGDRVRVKATWPFCQEVRDAYFGEVISIDEYEQIEVQIEDYPFSPMCYRADELERVEEKP